MNLNVLPIIEDLAAEAMRIRTNQVDPRFAGFKKSERSEGRVDGLLVAIKIVAEQSPHTLKLSEPTKEEK